MPEGEGDVGPGAEPVGDEVGEGLVARRQLEIVGRREVERHQHRLAGAGPHRAGPFEDGVAVDGAARRQAEGEGIGDGGRAEDPHEVVVAAALLLARDQRQARHQVLGDLGHRADDRLVVGGAVADAARHRAHEVGIVEEERDEPARHPGAVEGGERKADDLSRRQHVEIGLHGVRQALGQPLDDARLAVGVGAGCGGFVHERSDSSGAVRRPARRGMGRDGATGRRRRRGPATAWCGGRAAPTRRRGPPDRARSGRRPAPAPGTARLGVEGQRRALAGGAVREGDAAAGLLAHRVPGDQHALGAGDLEAAARQRVGAVVGDVEAREHAGAGAADEQRAVVDGVVLGRAWVSAVMSRIGSSRRKSVRSRPWGARSISAPPPAWAWSMRQLACPGIAVQPRSSQQA